MQKCATIAHAARRWGVDRATARAAIKKAGIQASELYASPRYAWEDVLVKVEGWPAALAHQIDVDTPLRRADELADLLGLTSQTIRNYGRTGRLRAIRISERAIRYCSPHPCENQK